MNKQVEIIKMYHQVQEYLMTEFHKEKGRLFSHIAVNHVRCEPVKEAGEPDSEWASLLIRIVELGKAKDAIDHSDYWGKLIDHIEGLMHEIMGWNLAMVYEEDGTSWELSWELLYIPVDYQDPSKGFQMSFDIDATFYPKK